jgi:hypothetical protein
VETETLNRLAPLTGCILLLNVNVPVYKVSAEHLITLFTVVLCAPSVACCSFKTGFRAMAMQVQNLQITHCIRATGRQRYNVVKIYFTAQ